jgi:glycosyltransferase involved in cell wall biosynthesis
MQKEITYILPDKDGGVASVVRNLLQFKSKQYRTKVILLRDNISSNCWIKDDFFCDEQIIITIDTLKDSHYKTAKEIRNHSLNSSLIISNDGGIELETIKLFKLTVPLIYILHGDYQYYYNCLKDKGSIIDGVIAVSDYVAENTKSIIRDFKFATVVFSEKFPLPKVIYKEKKQSNSIRFVYLGSLVEDKGVLLFKNILSILDDNNIDYTFDIIGDGILKSQLQQYFYSKPNITFHGAISNKEAVLKLSSFDIIMLCSYSEGLPVSVVEGMKNGLVPIVSDIPSGIPEIVIEGETGFKIPVGDETGFAEKIIFLYKNPDILKKLGHNAKDLSNKMFDAEIQTGKYEQIYEQVINNPNSKVFKKFSIKEKILSRLPRRIAFIVKNLPSLIKKHIKNIFE